MKLAACLLNISEARRGAVVAGVVGAAVATIEAGGHGAAVLNTFVDTEYNRSVITVWWEECYMLQRAGHHRCMCQWPAARPGGRGGVRLRGRRQHDRPPPSRGRPPEAGRRGPGWYLYIKGSFNWYMLYSRCLLRIIRILCSAKFVGTMSYLD